MINGGVVQVVIVMAIRTTNGVVAANEIEVVIVPTNVPPLAVDLVEEVIEMVVLVGLEDVKG